MSDKLSIKDWSIGMTCVGFIYCPPKWTSANKSSHQVYIPILMPKISVGVGKPASIPAAIDKSCYINDTACKPAVSTRVSIQNFVSVPQSPNMQFSHSIFYSGAKVLIDTQNENVDRMIITNREDSSTEPPK